MIYSSLPLAYPPCFFRTLIKVILLDGTTMAAVGAQLLGTKASPNDADVM